MTKHVGKGIDAEGDVVDQDHPNQASEEQHAQDITKDEPKEHREAHVE
jgi:hypothetical protein